MAKTENGLGKFGINFDDSIYKGPLTVGRPGREPGPEVRNTPVAKPDDPLKLVPMNSSKMSSKGGK
jgi:hypothetical protein